MKKKKNLLTFALFPIMTLAFAMTPFKLALATPAVVHAILFYSPSCPHCHIVMTEVLPPLQKEYGQKFDVVEINVDTKEGLDLYRAAVKQFAVPDDRIGVPSLFIGKNHLVGSQEIPEKLPGLIKTGLAAGGVERPGFPGLAAYLANYQPAESTGLVGKFALDPLANSLAVLVLLFMLFSMVWNTNSLIQHKRDRAGHWPDWALPVLTVVGMGIASYLSYVELTQVEAICGLVGDCNAVQMSSYAKLFGFLPVGVLGVLGYLFIFLAWLVARSAENAIRFYADITVWGSVWAGLLFMMYLTFLEPFVIGATCAWCLTSALIMTTILWASTGPASEAREKRKASNSPLIHPI